MGNILKLGANYDTITVSVIESDENKMFKEEVKDINILLDKLQDIIDVFRIEKVQIEDKGMNYYIYNRVMALDIPIDVQILKEYKLDLTKIQPHYRDFERFLNYVKMDWFKFDGTRDSVPDYILEDGGFVIDNMGMFVFDNMYEVKSPVKTHNTLIYKGTEIKENEYVIKIQSNEAEETLSKKISLIKDFIKHFGVNVPAKFIY